MLARLKNANSPFPAAYNLVKTLGNRQMVRRLSEILNLLLTDPQFRAFHDHETDVLPEFYHRQYEDLLGSYAPLMSREERMPLLVKPAMKAPVLIPQVVTVDNR
jgi:hypothetical protein